MSTEDDNVAKLKAAYARWNDSKAGNADIWLDLLHDDVQLRSLADGAEGLEFSGARHSRTEVERYLEQVSSDWEMQYYTVRHFVAQGDRVAVLGECSWKNRKTGKILVTPKADFWRFRDGKVVEFVEFYDTAKALAATH
jgi:hypothetical protein